MGIPSLAQRCSVQYNHFETVYKSSQSWGRIGTYRNVIARTRAYGNVSERIARDTSCNAPGRKIRPITFQERMY
jgi:hypothetical protein